MRHLFLITGTTRGIGKALTQAAEDQPDSRVVTLSRAAAFSSVNVQNIQIDLNDTDRIADALAGIRLEASDTVAIESTILINNAGVLDPIAPIGDCDPNQLAGNIRVNLTAPLVLCHHFYHFAKALPGSKWIVNITSGAAQTPYYGWSAYGAAKAGLEMATRAMALEFSGLDPAFNVCAVAPGVVDTDMQTQIRACRREQFEQVDKFRRLDASGGLVSADQVAAALILRLMENGFTNGGRYDLRELTA
jgi:benzil reductase ((S)-benzoin forming)